MTTATVGGDRATPRRARRDRLPRLGAGIGLLSAVALAAGLTGCSPSGGMKTMPAEVEASPRIVREAYAFASQHADVLKQLPCYCGCGPIGHKSNYDCYISGVDEDGTLSYDLHAVGCSICVDITRDTMRLLDEGQSQTEIRGLIDSTYSAFGPSNMP